MTRGVPWSPRPILAAFLMLAAGLAAGCTGDEAAPRNTVPGQVDLTDPNAIVIDGSVVDDELRPLAGVFVRLTPTDQSMVTDETGAFQFAVLDAGTYTLSAFLERFQDAETTVQVPASGLSGALMVLRPTPDGIPYHETQIFASYAFCHGPIGGGCFIVNTVTHTDTLPEDRPDFMYEIPNNGFQELRFEAQWDDSTTGSGGFISRNPNGLFLGCNNTQNPEPYDPTIHYYENNNPEMDFDSDGDPSVDREPSPVQMWVRAGQVNNHAGGCAPMPAEKGDQIWQTVRISPDETNPALNALGFGALDVRVDVFLTFFYWAKAEDRAFTVLES